MGMRANGMPSGVFTPVDVGTLALAEIRACRDEKAQTISTGWPLLDRTIRPLRPGKLCVVQAYTSNYKTGFMTHWARRLAQNIIETDARDRIVVYVSWEDTVEDMGIFDLAHMTSLDVSDIVDGRVSDAAVNKLEVAAFKRGALPEWVIGDTVGRGSKRPRMTMTHIEECLDWVRENMQFKPVAIFLDYLTLIAPERTTSWGDNNRRTDITELVYRCRDLGLAAGCPVILGAQSNRTTNDRAWKAPQKWDALESSAIEQYADTMISLWLPATTEMLSDPPRKLKGPDGSPTDLDVTPNLLILSVNKQKKGAAGGWYALHVDHTCNEIYPIEKEQAVPWETDRF